MKPATPISLGDNLTLHRIFIAVVLVGFLASFCTPLVYVGRFDDPLWHPGPSALSLFFHAIQSPVGFIPAIIAFTAHLLIGITLLRSLVPDALQATLALYGFALFTAVFAIATALVTGIMLVLWTLNAWAVGPGVYLWLGSLLATFLVVVYNHKLESTLTPRLTRTLGRHQGNRMSKSLLRPDFCVR